jgi:hypothetical protein
MLYDAANVIQLGIYSIFILALIIVGKWLESINGKRGVIDELLTPFPLGLGGFLIVWLERAWA